MDYYYFPTSHWSRAVSLALAEKGLTPRRHFVDIRHHGTFTPEYLRINPRGVVPTLVDDGVAVCDSLRIARYLDERYPPRLSVDGEEYDAWIAELEAYPLMLFSYAVWVKGRRGERSADILEEKITLARARAVEHPALAAEYERKARFFEAFRAEVYDDAHVEREAERGRALLERIGLQARPWIFGERYTFADCVATSILYRLVDLGVQREWSETRGHPLRDYYDRLRSRPSFDAVFLADPELARLRR
ncbi:MAG: glutathione S-transferase family protein [Myxococcales bacterium]|nr:glutathione S-transferase family protein [Myxococcales bacterium]